METVKGKRMTSKKSKKEIEFEQKIGDLTADLQRTRADFENFRKRSEMERTFARDAGRTGAVLSLLPVIDNIERATSQIPEDLKENQWVQGIGGLIKSLEKSLEDMKIKRIDASPGTVFNPELHDAIQFNENATGEHEIIEEQMQAGYLLDGSPIRHAMVRVTRK